MATNVFADIIDPPTSSKSYSEYVLDMEIKVRASLAIPTCMLNGRGYLTAATYGACLQARFNTKEGKNEQS